MVLIVLYCVVLCVYEFGGGACFRLLVFDLCMVWIGVWLFLDGGLVGGAGVVCYGWVF